MARTRIRLLVPVVLVGVVAGLGLSACGRLAGHGGGAGAQTAADFTDLSWDQQALQSIGFTVDEVSPDAVATGAQPAPSASASPGAKGGPGARAKRVRQRLLRFGFGKRLEHGEAVVQTDEGTKTVVVQRGKVTAVTPTTVTVTSADGFAITWTFGDPFHVVKDRTEVATSTITVGTAVGVAGSKDGGTTSARLLVETA